MPIYYIKELQDANSYRKGRRLEAKSLTSAKRVASRERMFQGTVLVIESEQGHRLSVKENKYWKDSNND